MANRRKRLRRWQWTNSIMWWAFIFSGIIHLGLIYLLPTVEILPADPGYIEVDESWLATIPDDEAPSELRDTPTDEGTEPASTQDAPTAWNFPPQVDAIEPAPATERNTDNTWETAFIGLKPALSERFEQPEIERTVPTQAIDVDIPPRTLKEMVVRSYPKPMPTSKVLEISAPEPNVDIETEVETQAEQRFQEALFSVPAQQISKNFDPEPLSVPTREILETEHEELATVTSAPRQTPIQPTELGAVSAIPSPTSAKSFPAVIVPEIPERLALDDEEVVATKPVLDFPESFAVSARPDPADELPEAESQAPGLLVNQKISLPESQQHDRKMDVTAFLPQNANNARPTLPSKVSHKIRVSSFSESADKRELRLNDAEMQARKPAFSHPIAQISEHVERPPDVPRSAMPKTLTARDRDEQMPVKGSSGTQGSLTKRSLIFGAGDDVPTLPLEGPRFGILAKKEDSVTDEELTPDTELRPEESLQQAEQQPEQPFDEFVIEGPAAGRQVLFKPRQFPDVELDMDVTIRLKFWVLPDGTVAEVIPLQRGDVRLERVAITYVKSWRFTPVSPEQPQVWGIIPIRYTLR